jgi:hypothetical protein
MNRQISALLIASLFMLVFSSVGCDLGTYNKRFKERSKPASEATETPADNADASSSTASKSKV